MIEYTLIRSKRKSLTLNIGDDLKPVVKAPLKLKKEIIDAFVNEHSDWIEEKTKLKKIQLLRYSEVESRSEELKEKARTVIPQKVSYYSELMGLKPTSIKITSAKKRFGSCSYKNGLCFSYMLMLYPDEAIDYVVVHELAHIKYKNHQKEFYKLIEQYMPNYVNSRNLLKF